MTRDELLALDDSPCLLLDGRLGLLIIYPERDDKPAGIQVPGEEDIRWVPLTELEVSDRGALRMVGTTYPRPSSHLEQMVLKLDWLQRASVQWLREAL